MQYMVVTDSDIYRLVEKVNELIKEGWRPQGGICYSALTSYLQAMVKDA